jgi:hypothetical protein
VNFHDIQEVVNVGGDDMITYIAKVHWATTTSRNSKKSSDSPEELLAQMSGPSPAGGLPRWSFVMISRQNNVTGGLR